MLDDLVVIIPTFRAKRTVQKVVDDLRHVGVTRIIVVDDKCPENSGLSVNPETCHVVFNKSNMGVGGAFKAGVEYIHTWPKDKHPRFIGKIDADMQHDASAFKHFLDIVSMHNVKDWPQIQVA